MQFKGVIKKILPMQTGTGKTGQSWQKVDFIMEEVTSGQYPESVAITAFGERVGELTGYSEGSVCLAVFDAHARCYTGRDGAKRKAMGVRAGFPDFIFLHPNRNCAYLAIELKSPKGRQTENQRQYQQAVEGAGGKYVVVRSFDEFVLTIREYMMEFY